MFLLYCLLYLYIYFKSIYLKNLELLGVMPNLFVIFILFIGLFYSRTAGTVYGVLFGILLGFVILSMNAEALIQRLVTYILYS